MSFRDLLEMDVQFVASINRSVYLELKDKRARENKSGEILEDAMQGDI